MPSLRPGREDVAAHARRGDLGVQLAGQLVQFGDVLLVRVGLLAHDLGLGAFLHPPLLILGGRVRIDDRLGFQMPALAALRGPEGPGPLGAGGADRGEGVAAGYEHLLDGAGVEVGAAQLHGPDAGAVLDGQILDDLTGERHSQPLGAGPSRYVQLDLLGWEG